MTGKQVNICRFITESMQIHIDGIKQFRKRVTKMALSMIEYRVLNILPRGAGYPMTTPNICKVTGLKERDVRESISILINRYGVPIVANRNGRNTGMFIATTEDERNIGITAFKSQVTTMESRINAIERADLTGWEQALRPDIKQLTDKIRDEQGA